MVTGRRSVRNFRQDIVPSEVIIEAVRVANHSPSVCNRQSWAIALVQDPRKVRSMLDLQNGNKGFDDTIANMIVVLADVRGFLNEYEIFEPFVDTGIFSGALVNALSARNIGSCCLNMCVSHHMAIKVAKALNLDNGLFPVMMIACGYLADDCRVAISSRLEPEVFIH
nr:nitroreductase family protein [Hydrogenophaga aromaticivorans]